LIKLKLPSNRSILSGSPLLRVTSGILRLFQTGSNVFFITGVSKTLIIEPLFSILEIIINGSLFPKVSY